MSQWVNKADRPPTEEDCDEQGCVLVWHKHQGILVYGIQYCMTNSFITHWMPAPEPPTQAE